MKTLVEIDRTLHEFEKKYGLTVRGAEQLSEAWFHMKLGVISASCASDAVAGKTTATRSSYMAELVAQTCTGVMKEMDFKQLEWGREHERAARSSVEFATGEKITRMGFVFKDDNFRIGCSPDGIIGDKKPTEIKCPWNSANYIKFVTEERLKSDWVWQNQFTLWVLDANEIDVTQYDPRMKTKPLHTVTVERDLKCIKQLEETIPQFILDMDRMLAKIGIEFGEQWRRIAKIQGEFA